ncbi:hypothetical protein BUMB_02926 [Candidatus Paraburkholderia calva]|nr:hypothetical protein BUMB_02926 [Candidatus Paraburkholderia calva]
MKRRHAALHDRVDEVLLRNWDPIGVAAFPAARDEYRSYVPWVVAMLLDGETEASIARIWMHIATVDMGVCQRTQSVRRTSCDCWRKPRCRPTPALEPQSVTCRYRTG